MGAWGTGSFQNDSALDWYEDFRASGAIAVDAALSATVTEDYIEVDEGSAAIAAAEIVAACFGNAPSDVPSEFDELVREYGEEDFKKTGIKYEEDLTLYKPTGCDACSNTGYRGRMGLHELLMGTDDCKRLIQRSAPMEEIRDQAITDGMTTLKQDGITKVFAGNTDLLQVRKVCIK